jgi:hypothetical protein
MGVLYQTFILVGLCVMLDGDGLENGSYVPLWLSSLRQQTRTLALNRTSVRLRPTASPLNILNSFYPDVLTNISVTLPTGPEMDPLSISLACITLIGAISQTSTAVANFVRDVRGVKSELDGVSRELQSLKIVLETLADDTGDPTKVSLPETLKRQIAGIVTNCMGIVVEIEHTVERHEGSELAQAVRWRAIGRGDISKLRSSLEAHKSALEIALDMVTLYG